MKATGYIFVWVKGVMGSEGLKGRNMIGKDRKVGKGDEDKKERGKVKCEGKRSNG